MPTTRVETAWAVPVKVEQLGAHLQAYTELRPIVISLRLCNRSGTGPQAIITKLPVELVAQVERYMIQDKREELLPQWARDLRCWENRCEPIDHLCDASALDLYNELQGAIGLDASGIRTCECCHLLKRATQISAQERDFVAEVLADMLDEGDDDLWAGQHDSRVASWRKRVGDPAAISRGGFDLFSKMLKDDFGLTVWISHVQEPRQLRYANENVAHSTQAYLRFPHAYVLQHEFKQHYVDWAYDPSRRRTEAGIASAFLPPPTLSSKDVTRFARALKVLNLDIIANGNESGSSTDAEQAVDDEKDVEAGQAGETLCDASPSLTMFVRCDDEEEW